MKRTLFIILGVIIILIGAFCGIYLCVLFKTVIFSLLGSFISVIGFIIFIKAINSNLD